MREGRKVDRKFPEKWPQVMSGLGFAVTFRVSASFLRSLDRAGKTKRVAPSSAPQEPSVSLFYQAQAP